MKMTRAAYVAAAVGAAGLFTLPAPGQVGVIYTNLQDDPSSDVPGVPGEKFRTPLAPFLTLQHSPTGSWWIFKAFTDNPDSDANDVIIIGNGTNGTAVAKEGQPADDTEGAVYGFMDSDAGINDSGVYAFGNRLEGVDTGSDEVIYVGKDSSSTNTIAVREGDPAPGLVDPGGAKGDEIFGNSLNSAHVLSDGTVAFRADLIDNVDNDYESALYHGDTPVAQEGTMSSDGELYDSFAAIGGSIFTSDLDGSNWIAEADIAPSFTSTDAVVVNDDIQLAEGDTLPGLGTVDGVFGVEMSGNGDWFARGSATGGEWAIRNGDIIAATGSPVTADNPDETWAGIHTIRANSSGDYLVGGDTTGPDGDSEVIALNGQQVVVRTGDAIDLDGDGEADNLFVGELNADDAFITDDLNDDKVDDRVVYFFAELRDDTSAVVGEGYLYVPLADGPVVICPADLDGDNEVGVSDLLELLAAWGSCPGCAADLDGNEEVGVSDLLELLAAWGPCE